MRHSPLGHGPGCLRARTSGPGSALLQSRDAPRAPHSRPSQRDGCWLCSGAGGCQSEMGTPKCATWSTATN